MVSCRACYRVRRGEERAGHDCAVRDENERGTRGVRSRCQETCASRADVAAPSDASGYQN